MPLGSVRGRVMPFDMIPVNDNRYRNFSLTNALKTGAALEELVCYCYGYTVADIETDFERNDRSTLMEIIQQEKKLGNCQCDSKNPKGR